MLSCIFVKQPVGVVSMLCRAWRAQVLIITSVSGLGGEGAPDTGWYWI